MRPKIQYEVYEKEKFYFILKVIAAAFGYLGIYILIEKVFANSQTAITFAPLLFYIVLIVLYLFFRMGILTGYLKGNALKISEKQFPEIHSIVSEQSELLGLKKIPSVYIMQHGGVLNAFAMRVFGANYVVLYSDVVEEALAENLDALRFIIGHELGHNLDKAFFLKLSSWSFPTASRYCFCSL